MIAVLVAGVVLSGAAPVFAASVVREHSGYVRVVRDASVDGTGNLTVTVYTSLIAGKGAGDLCGTSAWNVSTPYTSVMTGTGYSVELPAPVSDPFMVRVQNGVNDHRFGFFSGTQDFGTARSVDATVTNRPSVSATVTAMPPVSLASSISVDGTLPVNVAGLSGGGC